MTHPIIFLTRLYGEDLNHPGPETASHTQAHTDTHGASATVKILLCKANTQVRTISLAEVTSLGKEVEGFYFIIIISPMAQQILHVQCRFMILLKAL